MQVARLFAREENLMFLTISPQAGNSIGRGVQLPLQLLQPQNEHTFLRKP